MIQCNFIIGGAHIDIEAKESKTGLYQDNILHICRTSGEVLLKATANVMLLCKAFFRHLIMFHNVQIPFVIQCLDIKLCSYYFWSVQQLNTCCNIFPLLFQ